MEPKLNSVLREKCAEGSLRIGEVIVSSRGTGYLVHHALDNPHADALVIFREPRAARRIALNTADGKYRPLKSAPTLARGWRLELATIEALHEALDYLYPAALGNWRHWLHGGVDPVPLRTTLERQTGMYRVTRKISNEDANALVQRFCGGGCLKCILWTRDGKERVPDLPPHKDPPAGDVPGSIPLLCVEACNLLVAEVRAVVKGTDK
jgi:sirohydrochlorin cobaltochelatase